MNGKRVVVPFGECPTPEQALVIAAMRMYGSRPMLIEEALDIDRWDVCDFVDGKYINFAEFKSDIGAMFIESVIPAINELECATLSRNMLSLIEQDQRFPWYVRATFENGGWPLLLSYVDCILEVIHKPFQPCAENTNP